MSWYQLYTQKKTIALPQTARKRVLPKGKALPRTRPGLFQLLEACWPPTTGSTSIWPVGPRTQSRHGKQTSVRLRFSLTLASSIRRTDKKSLVRVRTCFCYHRSRNEREPGLRLFQSFLRKEKQRHVGVAMVTSSSHTFSTSLHGSTMASKRLAGKVILITGAAQGIGRASAVVSVRCRLLKGGNAAARKRLLVT